MKKSLRNLLLSLSLLFTLGLVACGPAEDTTAPETAEPGVVAPEPELTEPELAEPEIEVEEP